MTNHRLSLAGFLSLIFVFTFNGAPSFAAGNQSSGTTKHPAATSASTAPTSNTTTQAMPSIVPHDDSAEPWKGPSDKNVWNFSAMTGLGIVNATPGVALMGAAARKVIDRGFAPDLNDSVWAELEMGPVFAKGGAGLVYSAHLRWDFLMNSAWGFYGLGGFGGANTSQALGNKFEFYPRFAAGALWKIFADFTLRAEVSHELTIVGAQFEL